MALGPFFWGLIGLLLIGAEFFVPGVIIIFFGFGAVITAVASALFPALANVFVGQIAIWLASSALSLFSLRKVFRKIFTGTLLDGANSTEDSGKKGRVIRKITPDQPGRISYQGTTWNAISFTETIEPGEPVDILKKENMSFIVTKAILDTDEAISKLEDEEPHDQ